MYVSDCWAYEREFRAEVRPVNDLVGLSLSLGRYDAEVNLTFNREQLRQIRDEIDAFLSMEEAAPAATGAANGWTPPF